MHKIDKHSVLQWFDERLSLHSFFGFLSRKTVPRHKHSFWYLFGGLSLLFFIVQVITGMLLLLYYSPTPDTAYESVQFITNVVPFGWLVRSIHNWSSHLMIASVLIHFFSTYFMQAYRRPRELVWLSGILMLFIVLGFGFTGYLLPWDTTAYFATQIGTDIPKSLPQLGSLVVNILRGGEFVSGVSLTRFFALHVTILPIISLVVILFHLIASQIQGTSIPIGTTETSKSVPFFPNYLFRDLITWLCSIGILLSISILMPVHLGIKADPLASAPIGIKPEWYFLTLYQTLRMLPGTILGINSELLVNIVVGLLGILLILLPFGDQKANAGQQNRVLRFTGIVAIAYLILTTILSFLT